MMEECRLFKSNVYFVSMEKFLCSVLKQLFDSANTEPRQAMSPHTLS
jgi:hypothetical protein